MASATSTVRAISQAVALLASAFVLLSGCGGAAAGPGRSGSAAIGAGGNTDGSSERPGGSLGASGNAPDGSVRASDAGEARACNVSAACVSDNECCEGNCWGGFCQHAGCVRPRESGCVRVGDCCGTVGGVICIGPLGSSGERYCAQDPGGSQGPPLNGTCKVTAEGCDTDAECCSGLCTFGYCQTGGCKRMDEPCTTDSECCQVVNPFAMCGPNHTCQPYYVGH